MVDTPLGAMRAAAEDEADIAPDRRSARLRGLWFIGQKYFPEDTETWTPAPNLPVFISLRAWLKEYFTRKIPETEVPLSPAGTDFQKAVWKLLLEIPFGATTTYGAIAARLAKGNRGRPAAQAVGGAVGHNPISLIIPCHRVVGADGSLTGYAGGLEKKRALLEMEREINVHC